MRVLLISSNSLPAAPSGPAYVAGAARQAGHQVEIYERLFAADLPAELTGVLDRFQPEVVGISIRLVFGDALDAQARYGTRHTDLRPRVKEIVEIVQRASSAFIVLGGPGFNYYAADWLDYLDLDYGLRGEGEESFPLFLQRMEQGGNLHDIPGAVFRGDCGIHQVPPQRTENLDGTALPAYDLCDLPGYAARQVTPALFTKRGCAFSCTFCPYSKLEGKRYRLKSPARVLTEVRSLLANSPGRRVMFCDNSFNVPRRHAEGLCRAFIAAGLDFAWGSGDLKPIGVTDDFCSLMADSGCFVLNLSIESASDGMLRRMRRGYTVRQVRQALEALSRSSIPFEASLLLGAPGETPQTIAETLQVMDEFSFPYGVWVTLGVYLWTDYQDIVAEARQAGLLGVDQSLFEATVYLSPELSPAYLNELLVELRRKPGYQVQFNKPSEQWTLA